ncbi:MAG: hypothetical protein KZQ80_16270 [Candidatus Thiodiazotropha sp. (ex Monitilora ramsayi)]|nr:hypothetical protein [Candidatus Thiodiazotropha sp. (ex Monitilora ramsayi)]
MDLLLLITLEITLCLVISFILIRLLKPLLREVLTDTCGTDKRADFWVMFTQLMLVISPLLVVVYFTPTVEISRLNLAYELKQALFRTLLGDFIALSVIGQVMWRSIRAYDSHQAPQIDVEAR